MADFDPITIGATARCTDGLCGRVTQVVIDPVRDEVTHVIVEPKHRAGLGRLVPISSVDPRGDEIELRYTRAEFDKLQIAEEVHFLPGEEGTAGYDPDQALLWPYFGGNASPPVTEDTLPVGEVAIRRGEEVHASDGRVGQVEGLIVDSRTHHVTHLLLKEGHVFARKEVAIPMSAVASIEEYGIRLSLDKHQVEDLPPADFQRRVSAD